MSKETGKSMFLKGHKVYRYTPIQEYFDSEQENNEFESSINDSFITQEEQHSRKESKRKRLYLKIQHKKKNIKSKQQVTWDSMSLSNLPKQCLQINKELKKDSYNELKYQIDKCLHGISHRRIILVSGEKSIGKKTIITSVINELRDKQPSLLNQYYLDFQGVESSKQQQKLNKLHKFLQNTKEQTKIHDLFQTEQKYSDNEKGNEYEQIQRYKNQQDDKILINKLNTFKPSHIFIINGYEQFLHSLKKYKFSSLIKAIMCRVKSFIMIGVTNKNQKNPQQIIPELFTNIRIPPNSVQYFAQSLLCAVNNYSYRYKNWIIMKPLTNYYTTKFQRQNNLSLLLINKFINFLEQETYKNRQQANQQDQNDDSPPLRVTREILQKFYQRITNKIMEIDISQLNVHQKSLLIACYISLKEHQQILIPCQSAYKLYCWICQSLSLSSKNKKQFYNQIIYQLELYKIIKVRSGMGTSKVKHILLQIDQDCIKMAYEDESLFIKFFNKL